MMYVLNHAILYFSVGYMYAQVVFWCAPQYPHVEWLAALGFGAGLYVAHSTISAIKTRERAKVQARTHESTRTDDQD